MGGGGGSSDGTATGFLKNFLMGGTAGVISKTSCAPLERVKIILQNQAALEGASKQYSGVLGTGKAILGEQGVKALWRGNFVNCLRYFPTQAMNFACKEKYQQLLVPDKEKAGFGRWFAGYLAAGGAAGATSLTVAYPLEFAYTRLAADVQQKQFTGLFDCFGKIFQKEGVRGLYRGYAPSVCGIIVYRAGYFGIYDVGKLMLFGEDAKPHFLLKFGLALCVDIGAACTAYPFDTVRRRLMMQSGRAEMQYTGAIQALKYIVANEGVGGLYKGVFANNVRAIASALVLVLYDEMKERFD